MQCKKINEEPATVSAGAIAGVILGVLAVILIIAFFAVKAWKKRRLAPVMETGAPAEEDEKDADSGTVKGGARASTHTVASIASTVRTRASNIIQIAYIPGVTNRSAPSTPTSKIPPVPPLPYPDSPVNSQYPRSTVGDIQFAADDLLRASLVTVDNRSSIATTIYGGNAVVSQPNIVRAGKAAVVTVKNVNSANSSGSSPTFDSIPPVPPLNIRPPHLAVPNAPPSPAFSIGSTFMAGVNSRKNSDSDLKSTANNSAATTRTLTGVKEDHAASSFNYDSDDSDDFEPGHRGKKVVSECSSTCSDVDTGSPFTDANSVTDLGAGRPSGSRRLSSSTKASGIRSSKKVELPQILERNVSPFDDSNFIAKSPEQ